MNCKADWNLKLKDESRVSWRVTKLVGPEKNQVSVEGTNEVGGMVTVKNSDPTKTRGKLFFDGKSTESFDRLRDDRINSYVFNVAQDLPFSFAIDEMVGDAGTLNVGQTRQMAVRGTLVIAGIKSPVLEIPLLVKRLGNSMMVTPIESWKLNIRNGGVKNGIDLKDRIAHLMSFVPGVDMLDDVAIDFQLVLNDVCSS
jgi:hypothetical protein